MLTSFLLLLLLCATFPFLLLNCGFLASFFGLGDSEDSDEEPASPKKRGQGKTGQKRQSTTRLLKGKNGSWLAPKGIKGASVSDLKLSKRSQNEIQVANKELLLGAKVHPNNTGVVLVDNASYQQALKASDAQKKALINSKAYSQGPTTSSHNKERGSTAIAMRTQSFAPANQSQATVPVRLIGPLGPLGKTRSPPGSRANKSKAPIGMASKSSTVHKTETWVTKV